MTRISEALARFIERRPWLFIIIAVLLSAAAVPGLTMLKTETGFAALVSPEARISQDNARYQEQFGGEPVTVLLEGRLDDIFSVDNLAILYEFEQAVSQDERYRTVNSPVDLLRMAVEEAGMAGQAVIESVIYDSEGGVSRVMQPFIPDDRHVLIVVTPQGNMSDEESLQVSKDIEGFFSTHPLTGVNAEVISSSKLVDAISTGIGNNITILLGLSVVVMMLILIFVFRVRWRLLSLIMVGISALWTFGLMGYLSVPLTMATMAVLPILIGLGIDFSIQFHNRYQEEVTKSRTIGEAIITSISRMFPVIGIALLATIIGFITLYISKVPMIRDFGMVLAIGIVISYVVALFLLHSIVYLADKRTPLEKLRKAAKEASGRIERILLRLGKLAINHTLWIFIIAVLFAVGGGIVDHWLPMNTDYEELMPQDTPELIKLRELREIIGSGGTIHFMVEAGDVTSPAILGWLQEYQDEAMSSHPEIISVNSLATLVSEGAGGAIPPQPQIDAILQNTPPLYVAQVLSADHRMAGVSFNIKYISLEKIHDLLLDLQEEAHTPAGVTISPVGSLALGASTIDAIVGSRLTLNLICLGAVFLILVLVYRRLGSIIFTIIPVGAVIAWSSLDMYIIGIPLNPLTAILGVLIIGICTEFMVLLMGRYEEEKRSGLSPKDAMVTAISKIGRAIVTTALTTLGGFGVLIASNFVMIRDFGIATVVGVFLCLIITITVMPGLIVWYDNWRGKRTAKSAK
ncbi:MAG TPA: hydrophobe/amphiphile efflux-3 (HAE3) family transporter [Dehalococcoidales bacterium]|nr:hydrophobe/amphiphile efflux-3 (HAE3) family transporter [Dehalococcoidales bacterium]